MKWVEKLAGPEGEVRALGGDGERDDGEILSREEIERQAGLLLDENDEILLEWDVHPLKSRRDVTTRLMILLLLAYMVAYFVFGMIGVLLSVVFGALVAATYIFPTHYALTRRGVRLINWVARDKNTWLRFTGYEVYPDAVQLYFNRRTVRGWILRGNILFFNDDDSTREKIIDIVSRYLEPVSARD